MSSTEFQAEGLNSTLTATESGAVYDGSDEAGLSTADITGCFAVRTIDMRNVFQFQTTAETVGDDIPNDTRFFVNMDAWPYDLIINPMHASCDGIEGQTSLNSSLITAGDTIVSSAGKSKNLVKHEFIRYLSKELFGTAQATDLFTNEDEMATDLGMLGHLLWDSDPDANDAFKDGDGGSGIRTKLLAISDVSGLDASGNDINGTNIVSDEKYNMSYTFLQKLLSNEVTRTRLQTSTSLKVNGEDSTDHSIDNTGNVQPIPFVDGDIIEFNVTVNPVSNQYEQIFGDNSTTIDPRTYRIKLVLLADDDVVNAVPTQNLGSKAALYKYPSTSAAHVTQDMSIDVNRSYPYSGYHQSALSTIDAPTTPNLIKIYGHGIEPIISNTYHYPVQMVGVTKLLQINSGSTTEVSQSDINTGDNTLSVRKVVTEEKNISYNRTITQRLQYYIVQP